jgi:hypothetical protein
MNAGSGCTRTERPATSVTTVEVKGRWVVQVSESFGGVGGGGETGLAPGGSLSKFASSRTAVAHPTAIDSAAPSAKEIIFNDCVMSAGGPRSCVGPAALGI